MNSELSPNVDARARGTSPRARIALAALASALVAGCVSNDNPYSGAATGRPRTASTSGAGAGAASASSTTGGGSTTGSSTGATGGTSGTTGTCAPSGLTDCPAGLDEISLSLVDQATGQPITAPVQATGFGAPQLISQSLPCGGIFFCVDAGTQLTMQLDATGYTSSLLETLDVQHSEAYAQIPMINGALFSSLPTLPGGTSDSAVLIRVLAFEANPACADLSGWSFSLTDLDGGPVSSCVAYFSGAEPDPTATATDAEGTAVVFEIDPQASEVMVVGVSSTSPCVAANAEAQWTNRIPIENGYASLAPFLIDTDGGT